MEIEALHNALEAVKPAVDRMWHLTEVVVNRLYGTRGESGEAALFLVGDVTSFGELPSFSGLEHSDRIVSVPDGRKFSALRILSADTLNGQRVIAHILYEMQRQLVRNAEISNSELISSIRWLFPLLGELPQLLSPERQRGLVCECLLLRRLLQECRTLGLPVSTALARWWGPEGAKRDFSAVGIAIEAKSTANSARRHHFDSLDQLEPQDDNEEGYLFSIGLRSDPTASRKLGRYIQDIEELLRDSAGQVERLARAEFLRKLRSSGLHYEYLAQYEREPGILAPHLQPALYRIADLDRLRLTSFVGGKLPTMVVGVSFDLDIACNALTAEEESKVLQRLLLARASSQ